MGGEKRRGGSSSHVLRTTPTAKPPSPPAAPVSSLSSSASSSSSSFASAPSGDRNSDPVIATPPRAALSSGSTGKAGAADDSTGGGAPVAAPPSRTGTPICRPNTPHTARREGGGPRGRVSQDTPGDRRGSGNNSPASRSGSPLKDDPAAARQPEPESDASLKQQVLDLKRELEATQAVLRKTLDNLSQNVDAELREELEDLRRELKELRDERGHLRSGLDTSRRDLAARDREVADLKGQVRGLKDWLATSTRAAGVAPADDVFADGFSRLFNGLQNWLVGSFRRVKPDLSRADEATLEELAALVPTHAELISTSKLQMLQSLVSRILVEMIFDSYFVGLTEHQALQLAQTESLMESLVTGPEPLNQWRSTTLMLLNKEAAHTMHDETSRLTDSVVARINRLLGALSPDYHATADGSSSSTSGAPATPPRSSTPGPAAAAASEASLRQLVASSIELARLLAVQRASFRVFMPEVRPSAGVAEDRARPPAFDPARMEDVGGLDEEALAGALVCCATFPGIVKRGDEAGGHMQQYENVIAKARVLCNPG
ncbi:hypothetical protein RB595_004691 [Gaeumannomyces hyphopodioides]